MEKSIFSAYTRISKQMLLKPISKHSFLQIVSEFTKNIEYWVLFWEGANTLFL